MKDYKSVNFLEFIPERNIPWKIGEKGNVILLKEKSSKKFIKKIISLMNREQFMQIHLDDTGSMVWKMIDGKRRVGDISRELRKISVKDFPKAEERVSYFIGLMKKSDFVTLK